MFITTFNIRIPVDPAPYDWSSRLPRIKALIRRYDWELIGLQEAPRYVLEDLCSGGDFDFIGVGRNKPSDSSEGEFSAILFRPTAFKPLESGTFWLSETPSVQGSMSWQTSYPRICTWGRFVRLSDQKTFFYFNTHLDHRSHDAQDNGLRLILQRMAEPLAKGFPCFLTGDFNFPPSRDVLNDVKRILHYVNDVSRTPVSGPFATFHGFHPEAPALPDPIDYIFASPDVQVNTVHVVDDLFEGLPPSDHFPVFADVDF